MWRVFFCVLCQNNTRNESIDTHVQRQIQTDHVAPRQQLIKRDILRPILQLTVQLPPIMIDNLHPKHLRLPLQIPSDPAHPQDPEYFALRIVAQCRNGLSEPLALSE